MVYLVLFSSVTRVVLSVGIIIGVSFVPRISINLTPGWRPYVAGLRYHSIRVRQLPFTHIP